jgi:hypothetical protein
LQRVQALSTCGASDLETGLVSVDIALTKKPAKLVAFSEIVGATGHARRGLSRKNQGSRQAIVMAQENRLCGVAQPPHSPGWPYG